MTTGRLLLTGFAPFGGHGRNPSGDCVGALGREAPLRRAGLVTALLPVERRQAARALAEAVALHEPATLVMTGLAAGRDALTLERVAVNRYRPARPRAPERPILPGGAPRLSSTLPVGRSLAALGSGAVPARPSEDAGRYTCNLVLYLALAWREAGRLPTGGRPPARIGFVHLPPTPDVLGARAAAVAPQHLVAALRALCQSLLGAD